MRRRGLWLGSIVAMVVSGCPSEPSLSPAQRDVVSAFVGAAPPSPAHPLDVTFGETIRLLGYDVDGDSWAKGEALTVTWYWEALRTSGPGVRLVTFVTSDAPPFDQEIEAPSEVRRFFGPSDWRTGQYITDSQVLNLPLAWAANEATLRVGVFEGKLPVPAAGESVDGEERAVGPTLEVSFAGRWPPDTRSTLDVVQTPEAPRLDGRLDDAVWSAARSTDPFIDPKTGRPSRIHATAKVLWDPRYLYLGFDLGSSDDDSIGLVIDPRGLGVRYFEVRVSPGGVLSDARIDATDPAAPVEQTGWESRARVAVAPKDAVDDRVRDTGYTVEIAVPWQAFRSERHGHPEPSVGDRWPANLHAVDFQGDRRLSAVWAASGAEGSRSPDPSGIFAFRGVPDRAIERRGPIALPPDRAKSATTREQARDPGVRDALIKRRVQSRRHPGEPAAVPVD